MLLYLPPDLPVPYFWNQAPSCQQVTIDPWFQMYRELEDKGTPISLCFFQETKGDLLYPGLPVMGPPYGKIPGILMGVVLGCPVGS